MMACCKLLANRELKLAAPGQQRRQPGRGGQLLLQSGETWYGPLPTDARTPWNPARSRGPDSRGETKQFPSSHCPAT
jgi:hypothetical protein